MKHKIRNASLVLPILSVLFSIPSHAVTLTEYLNRTCGNLPPYVIPFCKKRELSEMEDRWKLLDRTDKTTDVKYFLATSANVWGGLKPPYNRTRSNLNMECNSDDPAVSLFFKFTTTHVIEGRRVMVRVDDGPAKLLAVHSKMGTSVVSVLNDGQAWNDWLGSSRVLVSFDWHNQSGGLYEFDTAKMREFAKMLGSVCESISAETGEVIL